MNDELVISSGLDQPLPFDNVMALLEVERIIDMSLIDGDLSVAFNACKKLIIATRVSGLALAKLLCLLKNNWHKFGIDKVFEDAAFQEIGLHKTTITRYIRTWEMLSSDEVPPTLVSGLQERPIKDLNAIATAWASGFPIKDEQWEKLVDASDNSEVLEVLREVKGAVPRKGSIIIRIERDGTLRVWPGGLFLGYLEINSEDDKVKRAIQRIINSAGIMEE